MKDMKEMLGKKKEIDPYKKESKLGVLKDLKDTMSGMMGEGLKGKMMEAKVAAKNPEDLKAGLEKAKHLIPDESSHEMPNHEEDMENPEEEASESPELEKIENYIEDCSDESQIDQLMHALQEKKKELMKG